MAKKRPTRARKTRVTNKQRVADYITAHADHTKAQIGRALKLTKQQVDACIINLRHQDFFPRDHQFATARSGKIDESFTVTEVVAIKKIGVTRAKQIIKLLEQIG